MLRIQARWQDRSRWRAGIAVGSHHAFDLLLVSADQRQGGAEPDAAAFAKTMLDGYGHPQPNFDGSTRAAIKVWDARWANSLVAVY